MEIATLVTTVMGIMAPWAIKGANEFISVAGEAAYNKTAELVRQLKAHWSGDKEAVDAVEKFQQKPERYQAVLEDVLTEKLAADPALANDLQTFVEALGPQVKVIQNMTRARHVVGLEAGEFNRGRAEIDQKIDDAENVTGAKLDRIG